MSNTLRLRPEATTDLKSGRPEVLERAFSGARSVGARTQVVGPAVSNPGLHVVVSGWACRTKALRDGRRQITALYVPGDILNLDALGLRNTDTTAETLTACVIATASLPHIRTLIEEERDVREALWRLTFVETENAMEWTLNLGQRTAYERLAHLFCELYDRLAAVGAATDGTLPLPLTQADLAEMLGLSVVHVNRSMQALKRQGLISMTSRLLTILDMEQIRQLSDFDPAYLHLDLQTA